MNTLSGLAILVLDLIAMVDCLKSEAPMEKKLLWILLVLILPVVGMILYFLLGKKQAA